MFRKNSHTPAVRESVLGFLGTRPVKWPNNGFYSMILKIGNFEKKKVFYEPEISGLDFLVVAVPLALG